MKYFSTLLTFTLIFHVIGLNAQVNEFTWDTYYGSTNSEQINAIATGPDGSIYIAGNTNSLNGIASGGHQTNYGGGTKDAFLVKFDENGQRVWSTYYGGSDEDVAYALDTDDQGNIYMSGYTKSTNNIADNGWQVTNGGGYDIFVVKFNSAGQRQWGTYFGGSQTDMSYTCTVDRMGNVYVGGFSYTTLGLVKNGYQTTHGGSVDGILIKFNSSGTAVWSSYYGGSAGEYIYDVGIDGMDNIYIVGSTSSSASIASGGYKNTFSGIVDAFAVKFDPSGSRIWGTYYGGEDADIAYSIDFDQDNNLFVAGKTSSTSGIGYSAHQNNLGGSSDNFVVKFASNGSREWGTYYGGSFQEDMGYVSVDAGGNVYLSGSTYSSSGIAVGGVNNSILGLQDAYFAVLDNDGNRIWSSYYGGEDSDYGRGILVDEQYNMYLTGYTRSTTGIGAGGYQATNAGSNDAFLMRITQAPEISDFSPSMATSGNTVIISGKNFSPNAGDNIVKVGEITIPVTQATATSLQLVLPEATQSGKLSIEVNGMVTESVNNLIVDNTAPEIQNNTIQIIDEGIDLSVSVSVTENETGVDFVNLEYRDIASGLSFEQVEMLKVGDNYVAQVPKTSIGELGIEYIIEAQNLVGLNNSLGMIKNVSVNRTNYTINYSDFGKTQANYRIFSIPLNLDQPTVGNVFETELGIYDPSVYRLFNYTNGKNNEMNSNTSLAPGNSYWIIVGEDPGISLTSSSGNTVDVNSENLFEINLKQGWNQIGNPYPFNVSWDDVKSLNPGLGSLKIFDGAFKDSNILYEGSGGFVFVESDRTIQIPVVKNPAANSRTDPQTESADLSLSDWQVDFILSSGEVINQLPGFGMNSRASQDMDIYDEIALPGMFDKYLTIIHENKEINLPLEKNIVPTQDEYVWTFQIESKNISEKVKLGWNNENFGSNDKGLILWDDRLKREIDMREEDFYEFYPNQSSRTFKVYFGKQSDLKNLIQFDGIQLNNIYPNPVSEHLTIPVSVSQYSSGRMNIRIFSGRGELVYESLYSVEPGYQEFGWDVPSNLHSGIYILQVLSGDNIQSSKFSIKNNN